MKRYGWQAVFVIAVALNATAALLALFIIRPMRRAVILDSEAAGSVPAAGGAGEGGGGGVGGGRGGLGARSIRWPVTSAIAPPRRLPSRSSVRLCRRAGDAICETVS